MISPLLDAAPWRPAEDNDEHFERPYAPPRTAMAALPLCHGLDVQQGGSCCAGKPLRSQHCPRERRGMSGEYTQGLKPADPQQAEHGQSGQEGSCVSARADALICKKRGRESDAVSLNLPRRQHRTPDVAVSRKEVRHPQSQSCCICISTSQACRLVQNACSCCRV